jgi:hypothetical protein
MQGRSRMAALAFAVGLVSVMSLEAFAEEKPVTYKVKLGLVVAGLGREGCDVEIKPAHPSCKFRTATRHVTSEGMASLDLNVRTESADRECAFAITIREPGQAARTVCRGLQLKDPKVATTSSLTCYLTSPSKLAKADQTRIRK